MHKSASALCIQTRSTRSEQWARNAYLRLCTTLDEGDCVIETHKDFQCYTIQTVWRPCCVQRVIFYIHRQALSHQALVLCPSPCACPELLESCPKAQCNPKGTKKASSVNSGMHYQLEVAKQQRGFRPAAACLLALESMQHAQHGVPAACST